MRTGVVPMSSTVVLLQHGTKAADPVDPGLTDAGWRQVRRAATVLSAARPTTLACSPLRRARESIRPLAEATGLRVVVDERVRERLEFDPSVWASVADFLDDWRRTVEDRDAVPASGDTSHAAATRLRDAVLDHAGHGGLAVVATHGGVTVDLLRTVAGDARVPELLLHHGMPSGHLTTLRVSNGAIEVIGIGVEPGDWAAPDGGRRQRP